MSYRQEQQSFSFPMLSGDEILMCMKELQIPLQKKDLEKPSANVVRTVYESLCETLIGVTREDMNTPVEEAMGGIEYPELHEESIPVLTFFRFVQRLMLAAGVRDTNILDITKPDAKRFRRNLSAVINFAKFREERLVNFTEMCNETENLLDQKAQLEESCAVVEDKIRQIQRQREEEMPEVDRLREECKQLEQELKQSNKQHASLQYETKQLKAQSNEMKDYIATLRFQKLNVVQECERMQGNIVQSPERLKEELATQKQQLEHEKQENSKLSEQLEGLAARNDVLEKAERQIEGLLKLMTQVEETMMGCKEASRDTKRMGTSIKEHGNMMRQLETQKTETEKQIEITRERLEKLSSTKSVKSAAAAHALNESNNERDLIFENNEKIKAETTSYRQEIHEYENKIATEKQFRTEQVNKRREAFKRLDNMIDNNCSRLIQHMD